MADIEAMYPIYFPRGMQEGQAEDEYNAQVAQNENLCNQNFKILYDELCNLRNTVSSLTE